MSGLRVVLVTRRFWPLFGGAENTIADLAVGLKRRGAEPTVLTARWSPDWSPTVYYSGVPVLRLPRSDGQSWRTARYLLALARWLQRHRDQIDVVCVSGMRWDAFAAAAALRQTDIPVVLRADRAGTATHGLWQLGTLVRRRLLARCRTRWAVIATDEALVGDLRHSGHASERIYRIPNGVLNAHAFRTEKRSLARSALAEANADLLLTTDSPVVVYAGRLRKERGLRSLVDAWPAVRWRLPDARLWLFGDGPMWDELHARIRDLELRDCICMPGTVDEVGDVLGAANVFVHPGGEPGLPRALLEAIAAGVPVIAGATSDIRQCRTFQHDHAILVPPNNPQALSEAILAVLEHPPPQPALAAARRRALHEHSASRMIDAHLRLFESLVPRGAVQGLQGDSRLVFTSEYE
jgi:glycosyltransferase involved in cell wall biosynthesis